MATRICFAFSIGLASFVLSMGIGNSLLISLTVMAVGTIAVYVMSK